LARNNPTAARRAVEQLATYFPGHAATVRLQKLLADTVTSRLEQARKCAADQNWDEAQTLLNTALGLAPDSKPAQTLLAEAVASIAVVVASSPRVHQPPRPRELTPGPRRSGTIGRNAASRDCLLRLH
jgi:hypothetical protein